MIEFKMEEFGKEYYFRNDSNELSWQELMCDFIQFLYGCGYVGKELDDLCEKYWNEKLFDDDGCLGYESCLNKSTLTLNDIYEYLDDHFVIIYNDNEILKKDDNYISGQVIVNKEYFEKHIVGKEYEIDNDLDCLYIKE